MKNFLLLLSLIKFSVSASAEVVSIGLASNFSELSTISFNPFGGYFKDAVSLAIAERKNELSRKNIEIKLLEFDYGSADNKVGEVVQEVIKSNVSIVVGYNYSSHALLAAPLHVKAKIPMLSPSASANRLGSFGKYVHLGSFNNSFMAESLAKLAKRKLKFQKALIISAVDCAYCVDLAKSFEKEFVQAGGEVVKNYPILQDDKDFRDLSKSVKEMEYDFIFIPNQELTSARIISTLIEAGFNKPFLGADGWGNEGKEFFRVLKGKSFTGYSVTHWHPKLNTIKSKRFVKAYLKSFNKLPNDTSVLAYDSMNMLIDVLLTVESKSRESLENALSSVRSFHGITGNYSFNAHKAPRKDILVLKTNNSQFEIDHILKADSL